MLKKIALCTMMIFSLATAVGVAAPDGPIPGCGRCVISAAPDGPIPGCGRCIR